MIDRALGHGDPRHWPGQLARILAWPTRYRDTLMQLASPRSSTLVERAGDA